MKNPLFKPESSNQHQGSADSQFRSRLKNLKQILRSSPMEISRKGFTLIEILVVLTLLAMAGTLVSVNVGKSAANKKPRAFAQQMISLCKKARRVAVDHGEPTALYISSNKRCCWISGKATSLEFPEQMLVEGEGVGQLGSDIHAIRFYPDGSSSGGELTLSISGQTVYAFRVDMLTGLLTRIGEEV